MRKPGRWPGTWRVICQVCGFEFPSSEIQKRWDGLLVCKKDLESRHPQTLIKIRSETSTPAFVSAEPEDTFVQFCDIFTSSGFADVGTADCMRADNLDRVSYPVLLDLVTNGHETYVPPPEASPITPYRFYRLYITQNGGDNTYTSMGEMYLYDGVINRLASAVDSAESSAFGGNTAQQLFDGGSPEEWVTENGQALPSWVSFDLGAAYPITSYAIMSQHIIDGRNPATWLFQGNNTGLGANEPWVTLNTQTEEFAWDLLETRTYTI